MSDKKNYAKLTQEELLVEEKRLKKSESTTRFLIGVSVGILIFGLVKNGIGFLHIFLPLLLITGIYKNGQNQKNKLKQIQEEMDTRDTA